MPPGVQVLEVYGSLFFGAVGTIETLPALLQPGVRALVLDMHRLVLIDTSGLDALHQLWRQLQRRNVGLVLARVNEQPLSLMRRSGFEAVIGAGHIALNLDTALVGAAAHATAAQNRRRSPRRKADAPALRGAARSCRDSGDPARSKKAVR